LSPTRRLPLSLKHCLAGTADTAPRESQKRISDTRA